MIQIDMPMPDNCLECRFNTSEFGYCNAMPIEFVGQVSDSEEDGKPEWCPLKAQEPRVMTLEEALGGDECWVEYHNGGCGYADCYLSYTANGADIYRTMQHDFNVPIANYGKTWRCWDTRPTDEQREKEAWNG